MFLRSMEGTDQDLGWRQYSILGPSALPGKDLVWEAIVVAHPEEPSPLLGLQAFRSSVGSEDTGGKCTRGLLTSSESKAAVTYGPEDR